MVKSKWDSCKQRWPETVYFMDKWHENLSALRQYLKGWSANINGMYKKKKEELMQRIQEIDNKAEGEDTGAENAA